MLSRPIFRTSGFYCMDTCLSVINEKKNVHSYSFMWQVQSDHFHEIFAPELDKHGYQALYKRKTNEVGSLMIPTHSLLLMLESLLTLSYTLLGSQRKYKCN